VLGPWGGAVIAAPPSP